MGWYTVGGGVAYRMACNGEVTSMQPLCQEGTGIERHRNRNQGLACSAHGMGEARRGTGKA